MSDTPRRAVDQVVDLFVYAPIGALYERDELLSRAVRRGRSQVQLARVLGQMALRQGQQGTEGRLGEVLGPAGSGLARAVTELGALLGLAPPRAEGAEPGPPPEALAALEADPGAPARPEPVLAPSAGPEPGVAPALPIADYDQLPARVIIPLLVDLTPEQRRMIRAHEVQHRGRKTVLGQIDRLGS